MSGVLLLGDWEWHPRLGQWSLHCRLIVEQPGLGIPRDSDWHILVATHYPWGSIAVHPAREGGIQCTYAHQGYNGWESADGSWRSGPLCLSTTVRALGRSGLDTEPYVAEERLRWHIERAQLWLAAAASGSLTLPGEPFELPQFPVCQKEVFAFSESSASFPFWNDRGARAGLVESLPWKRGERFFIARRFRDLRGRAIYAPAWGDSIKQSQIPLETGLWIRLDALPVLMPWQAPATWGELRLACRHQDIDLDALLQQVVPHAREGKPLLLCIGFPIPANVGGCPVQIHWQAVLLPPLTKKGTAVRGFRPSEAASWHYDRRHALRENAPLRWLNSENWHMDEITARGRLPESVAARDVLLIGAGALGAPVARLLIRAGVRSLVVVDEDVLRIGNLTRHTLDSDHLSLPKADSLAVEFRKLSPHVHIHSIQATFPNLNPDDRARIARCDLILDCTGEDAVAAALAEFCWEAERAVIVSLSLGMEAQQLFCYSAQASAFTEADFHRQMAPWLARQAEAYRDSDLPRDGIGCWHPVFPARADDVWLLAATAIKEIERVLSGKAIAGGLTVFEQTFETDGFFAGIRRRQAASDAS